MSQSLTAPVAVDRRPFVAILAKDWRLFRVPMFGLISVAVAAYSMALAIGWLETATPRHDILDNILNSLWTAEQFCILLTPVLAATFGGTAIAGERTERTVDFMAMLPVSRVTIVASKWIVSAVILLIAIALHTLLWSIVMIALRRDHLVVYQIKLTPGGFQSAATFCIYWVGCTISFFGFAWVIGAIIKSGPISASAGIGVTLLEIVSVLSITGFSNGRSINMLSAALLLLMIGGGSILGATVYYVRRVAP